MPERILQWKEEYSNDEEVYLQSKKILTPEHLLAHKKIIDLLQNLIKKMRFNDQNMLERDLALFSRLSHSTQTFPLDKPRIPLHLLVVFSQSLAPPQGTLCLASDFA